jgi:hypothetical protein
MNGGFGEHEGRIWGTFRGVFGEYQRRIQGGFRDNADTQPRGF